MKLVLDNGAVYELTSMDALVLDCALVAFNGAKEEISYFDEETKQTVYASYEKLRALVPFLGQEE